MTCDEAQRAHLENLTKVKGDCVAKVAPRTDATTIPGRETTKSITGRCVNIMYDDGATKTRCTTRGSEQTLHESEDFFSATPATIPLKTMLADASLKGHVVAIEYYSGTFYQSLLNPRRNRAQSLDRSSGQSRIGTKLHLGSRVSIPRSQGSTENLGHTTRTVPRTPCRWSSHDTTVTCSTDSNQVKNKSSRKQDDTSTTSW